MQFIDTATYLTTIDTLGNLVRDYKFEHLESYEYEIENQRGSIKSPRTTGHIALLGVADEHILVASAVGSVYQDLSGGTYESRYDANKCFGVGMIDTSDFLKNKEIQIKQIYSW